MIKKLFLGAFLFGSLLFSSVVTAQENITPENQTQPSFTAIKLAIKPLDPFVTIKNGNPQGFSMDLWNAIAKDLNLTTVETKEYPTVTALIESISAGQNNVGIAGISITAEREEKVDFTYPMFRSGLSILTTSSNKGGAIPDIFLKIGAAVWNYDFGILALSMLLISIIPAIIIYLVERRKIDGFLDDTNLIAGVLHSYFWCFTGIFGQEDRHPATKTGKIFGLIWMVFGVLFLSFFTAQVTANLTTDKLNGTIHGIEDLRDKKVATIKGTTSSKYLMENKIDFLEFADLKSAVESVDKKETVAVIYDKPALEFFASQSNENKYSVVGGAFTTEDYGIVLPTGSPFRKKINESLLKLYQNGKYEEMRIKWFGKNTVN
jgi:polar amino acid transport system substrate-binding protein